MRSTREKNLCPYYKKYALLKRIMGCMGFCELQNKDINNKNLPGQIPYKYCEGKDRCSKLTCGVYIHFSKNK